MSSERGLIHSNDGGKVTAENMAHIQLKEILHIKTLSLFEKKRRKLLLIRRFSQVSSGYKMYQVLNLQKVSNPDDQNTKNSRVPNLQKEKKEKLQVKARAKPSH
ncbi:hypothetical protein B296_00032912 [Ensete ventricosum]|uniref:Uncharacterized protein n=1 Tax=Ensete ventricosum TaxID=4639 RepID=A0A427AAG2_ENSVE|nr:hypothetical protein B296_00032912 [Ensete ventricosum]